MKQNRSFIKQILKDLKIIPTEKIIDRVIELLPSRGLITDDDIKIGLDDDTLDDVMLRLIVRDGNVEEFTDRIKSVLQS